MYRIIIFSLIIFNSITFFGNPPQEKTLSEDEWYAKIDKVIREFYDPVKEIPYNENQIKADINSIMKKEKEGSSSVFIYISDNYLRKGRIKAGLFAFEQLSKLINDTATLFEINKVSCYCKYYIYGSKTGDECLWYSYLKRRGPYKNYDFEGIKLEELKIMDGEMEYDILFTNDNEIGHYFGDRKLSTVLIEKFLALNRDIESDWKNELQDRYNFNIQKFKDGEALDKLEKKRKSMMHEFISKLEQLLVERNENKLSDFFKVYALTQDDYTRLFDYFKDQYFNKDFHKVTFKYSEPYPYSYTNEDSDRRIRVEANVVTEPPASGSKCPRYYKIYQQPIKYCYYVFHFFYKTGKIFIEYF